MSDSIVDCTVYKNPDETILRYSVTFSFDGVEVPEAFCTVFVASSALVDPTDLNEVKTVACSQASLIKVLYSNATDITDINGPVSL